MSGSMRAAVFLVRAWTWLYTLGLPEEERARRQQEIESDLWESLNDPGAPPRPLPLLARLLAGVPDDLGWRVERPRLGRPLMFALAFAGVGTLLLMGFMAWAGSAATLPRPEPIMQFQADRRPPPPPPPPPPNAPRAAR